MIDKELMELVEFIQQLYEQAFMFYSPDGAVHCK